MKKMLSRDQLRSKAVEINGVWFLDLKRVQEIIDHYEHECERIQEFCSEKTGWKTLHDSFEQFYE